MAVTYSVSMNKGGVGKTSLVSNLAGALSRQGNKVLIIDTDGQGNSSMAFGLNPLSFEDTSYDVFVGNKEIKDVSVSISDNLDIVPANDDLNFLEFDILPNLKKYGNPFHLLRKEVEKVKDKYDYILIDTPPSMGLVAGNTLVTADHVIIPFVPEMFAVRGLVRVVDAIEEFKAKENPNLSISGIVGMMFERKTVLHSTMLQEARAYCDRKSMKLFETTIPKSIRFASATAFDGKPAVWTDSTDKMVSAYFELLEEIKDGEREEITN